MMFRSFNIKLNTRNRHQFKTFSIKYDNYIRSSQQINTMKNGGTNLATTFVSIFNGIE